MPGRSILVLLRSQTSDSHIRDLTTYSTSALENSIQISTRLHASHPGVIPHHDPRRNSHNAFHGPHSWSAPNRNPTSRTPCLPNQRLVGPYTANSHRACPHQQLLLAPRRALQHLLRAAWYWAAQDHLGHGTGRVRVGLEAAESVFWA